MISALAVMLVLSSPPGFWIETRTSKVVTLSFSTPSGRDLGDLALERLVLERLDHDAGPLAQVDLADVGLVDLAEHVDLAHVAQRHHQGRLRAEDEDRAHRVAHLDVAREDEPVHGAA